jgi:hypothetical protein
MFEEGMIPPLQVCNIYTVPTSDGPTAEGACVIHSLMI